MAAERRRPVENVAIESCWIMALLQSKRLIITRLIKVTQYSMDYTNCNTAPTSFAEPSDKTLGIKAWKYDPATQKCSIQFQIDTELPVPVYMYYRLTNFYQNNRKYVKSFDLNQLKGGTVQDPNALAPECEPLRSNPEDTWVKVGEQNITIPKGQGVIYPCGLIANSMFSGEFLKK